MKITMYELLGLVKDDKAPKKIKFRNEIYEYENHIKDSIIDYVGIEKETNEVFYLSSYIGNNYISDIFTDEVEIIEESKPITKESIEALGYACGEIRKCFENGWNKSLENKPLIEEPKKIEYPILHKTAPSETTGDQMPNWRNLIDCNFEYLNKTICQLIDEINNLKEK